MRAPEFWRSRGAVSNLLWPAAQVWRLVTARRIAQPPRFRAPVPVICVGNVTAGGTGKTPVAMSLAAHLAERGIAAHFLSRGYRGQLAGPVQVDPQHHSFRDVGDEPLLLAAQAPTWVARDRAAGGAAAVAAGAQALVMDDGFQNPTVAKDISLLVVDGGFGFGNHRCLPSGPMREPLADALARAHAVVIVGDDREEVEAEVLAIRRLPILTARYVPAPAAEALAGKRVVAFAGIGRPEKFFETLVLLGAELVEAIPYPDHHAFADNDIMMACEIAAERDAIPVTTEKDFVRLPREARPMVTPVPVTLAWEDEAALARIIGGLLSTGRGGPDASGPDSSGSGSAGVST